MDREFKVMRVHAALRMYSDLAPIYKKYGQVIGSTVSRDFIVPDDMPLWALHYALTTAFGFQNEHLHYFSFPSAITKSLTGDSALNWSRLVGTWFRFPITDGMDYLWCDDYEDGSFRSWRKRKYTGPYVYNGIEETNEYCLDAVASHIDPNEEYDFAHFRYKDGDHWCRYYSRCENDPYFVEKKTFKFRNLTNEMLFVLFERRFDELLEPLTLSQLYPVSQKLEYEYDFGDSWKIDLTLSREQSPKTAEDKCLSTHRPVMLAADGLNLVEDAGGVHGFSNFLLALYGTARDIARHNHESDWMSKADEFEDAGCEQYEDRESSIIWAESLGWKEKLPPLSSWF